MKCYEVIADKKVSSEIKSLYSAISAGTDEVLSNKALINYKNSIEVVQPFDIVRYFVERRLCDSSNKALANIFLAHLNSTELKSAGSGIIFCLAFLMHMRRCLQTAHTDGHYVPEAHSFTGKKTDVKTLSHILSKFSDKYMTELVVKSAEHVGAEGSMNIEALSDIERTTITVDDMYSFDAKPSDVFVQQSGITTFELLDPSIFTIDGFIESTSEIDNIMRESFESGKPGVIIARGFAGDVSNTLAHNYVHGKLRVIPVEVRYDEVGANSLIDISKVAGSKFINSLRGDLISTTGDEESGCCLKANVGNGKLGLRTKKDKNSLIEKVIARQRLKLMKKMNTSQNATREILETRIKSLTPKNCTIHIKTRSGMEGVEKDRCMSAVRMMKDVCTYGFVDLTKIKSPDSYFMQELLGALKENGFTHVSARTINVGIYSAAACSKTLAGLGACLVIDEKQDSLL